VPLAVLAGDPRAVQGIKDDHSSVSGQFDLGMYQISGSAG